MPLTSRVRNAIEILFRKEEQEQVADLLGRDCGAGLPLLGAGKSDEVERVQLAVLKCGNGLLEGTLDAVVMAQRDWRDVLVQAGFGDDLIAHLEWNPMDINVAKAKDIYLWHGCSTYGMCHEGDMEEYGRLLGELWGTPTHHQLVKTWEEEYISQEIPHLFGQNIVAQHQTLVGFGMHRGWANRVIPDILKLMRTCDDYMKLWCADALLNLAWPLYGERPDPSLRDVREETRGVLRNLAHEPLVFLEETQMYFRKWRKTAVSTDLPADIHSYVKQFAAERLQTVANKESVHTADYLLRLDADGPRPPKDLPAAIAEDIHHIEQLMVVAEKEMAPDNLLLQNLRKFLRDHEYSEDFPVHAKDFLRGLFRARADCDFGFANDHPLIVALARLYGIVSPPTIQDDDYYQDSHKGSLPSTPHSCLPDEPPPAPPSPWWSRLAWVALFILAIQALKSCLEHSMRP